MTKKSNNIVAVIQARMNSTRLPGKILKTLIDKTVLEQVVERLKLAQGINQIVVATTTASADDQVAKLCEVKGIAYFRGSEEDVLGRYYFAVQQYNADGIIRITADCPLIDPKIIEAMIEIFKTGQYDVVTNISLNLNERTFPRGLDAEIFSRPVLEDAFQKAKELYQREHVTPYLYEHVKKIYFLKNKMNYSQYRWTLDTPEDFELIESIYKHIYRRGHDFFLPEIVSLMQQHPELEKLNRNITQKQLK